MAEQNEKSKLTGVRLPTPPKPNTDVIPLRLATPPAARLHTPPNAAGEAPIRLPTPPRPTLTPPQPPSYAHATTGPAYKQIPTLDQQQTKERSITSSSNNTPTLGGGSRYGTVPITPLDGRQQLLQHRRQEIIDRYCKPEGKRRWYMIFAAVCACGIPCLLGFIALLIYLALRPHLCKVTIYGVKIMRFSATGGADSGGDNPVLNMNLDFTLLAVNPNKKLGMQYMEINMLVSFQNTSFPLASIAPFYQKKRNATLVTASVKAANAALDADDGSSLQFLISQGDVPLKALIDVKAAVQAGSWKTPSFRRHMACDIRIAPPSSTKSARLLSKVCKRTKKSIPDAYVTTQNILD